MRLKKAFLESEKHRQIKKASDSRANVMRRDLAGRIGLCVWTHMLSSLLPNFAFPIRVTDDFVDYVQTHMIESDSKQIKTLLHSEKVILTYQKFALKKDDVRRISCTLDIECFYKLSWMLRCATNVTKMEKKNIITLPGYYAKNQPRVECSYEEKISFTFTLLAKYIKSQLPSTAGIKKRKRDPHLADLDKISMLNAKLGEILKLVGSGSKQESSKKSLNVLSEDIPTPPTAPIVIKGPLDAFIVRSPSSNIKYSNPNVHGKQSNTGDKAGSTSPSEIADEKLDLDHKLKDDTTVEMNHDLSSTASNLTKAIDVHTVDSLCLDEKLVDLDYMFKDDFAEEMIHDLPSPVSNLTKAIDEATSHAGNDDACSMTNDRYEDDTCPMTLPKKSNDHSGMTEDIPDEKEFITVATGVKVFECMKKLFDSKGIIGGHRELSYVGAVLTTKGIAALSRLALDGIITGSTQEAIKARISSFIRQNADEGTLVYGKPVPKEILDRYSEVSCGNQYLQLISSMHALAQNAPKRDFDWRENYDAPLQLIKPAGGKSKKEVIVVQPKELVESYKQRYQEALISRIDNEERITRNYSEDNTRQLYSQLVSLLELCFKLWNKSYKSVADINNDPVFSSQFARWANTVIVWPSLNPDHCYPVMWFDSEPPLLFVDGVDCMFLRETNYETSIKEPQGSYKYLEEMLRKGKGNAIYSSTGGRGSCPVILETYMEAELT